MNSSGQAVVLNFISQLPNGKKMYQAPDGRMVFLQTDGRFTLDINDEPDPNLLLPYEERPHNELIKAVLKRICC
jgi:hypothetical protein